MVIMADISELERQHIDTNKLSAINSNRLVTFMNHFIVSIVEQLNQLTAVVDSRLHTLNNKINICHSNLVILELKLNSISGLSSANQLSVASVPQSQTQPQSQSDNNNAHNNQTQQLSEENAIETTDSKSNYETNSEPNEELEVEVEVEVEDERMVKYRKMIHLGIPLGAVRQKMMTEGVDPSLLKL